MFSNFIAGATVVWPASKHTLVRDYSNSKEVGLVAMILVEENFGAHIARCATCVGAIIGAEETSNTKISNLEVA